MDNGDFSAVPIHRQRHWHWGFAYGFSSMSFALSAVLRLLVWIEYLHDSFTVIDWHLWLNEPKNIPELSFDGFGLHGRDVLLCEVTASGATSSAADAFRRRAWRQPSAIFFVPIKIGYSVRALWLHTCLMLPCVRSVHLHIKRFSRPGSSKSFTKGKRTELTNIRNYDERNRTFQAGYQVISW